MICQRNKQFITIRQIACTRQDDTDTPMPFLYKQITIPYKIFLIFLFLFDFGSVPGTNLNNESLVKRIRLTKWKHANYAMNLRKTSTYIQHRTTLNIRVRQISVYFVCEIQKWRVRLICTFILFVVPIFFGVVSHSIGNCTIWTWKRFWHLLFYVNRKY